MSVIGKDMDNKIRKPIFFFVAVLAILGFLLAFNFNMKANDNRKLFEKEMAFRLDMEEKVSKLRSENMELTSAVKNKDLEIQKKDQAIADFEQASSKQKESVDSLQLELKAMTLLKNQLEEDLRQALSQGKIIR